MDLNEDIRQLLTILQHIHTYGMMVQSNHAREQAHTIARAASKGMITTQILPGCEEYGRLWKITLKGLHLLTHAGFLIEEQELAAYRAKPVDRIIPTAE